MTMFGYGMMRRPTEAEQAQQPFGSARSMREQEVFELQVDIAGTQGGHRVITGGARLIVETIDALMVDPRLMGFNLKREANIDRSIAGQVRAEDDTGDDAAS